jgi:TonB family protein
MDTPKYSISDEKLQAVFNDERRSLLQWLKDNQTGIYVTIIFHLMLLLGLSLNEIRVRLSAPHQFAVIEFVEQQPEPEEKKTDDELKKEKEELKKQVEEMMKNRPDADIKTPNLAVNLDAKGTSSGTGHSISFFSNKNTATLRSETERKKQEELEKKEKEQTQGVDQVNISEQTAPASPAYKGPSIVSYLLTGRTALSLPVPAYKCLNGGDVTVLIEVNRQGYVISAEVDSKNSSSDECLHISAIQAAKEARFSSGTVDTQTGNIVYRFIKQ